MGSSPSFHIRPFVLRGYTPRAGRSISEMFNVF
jgi:hypothetical protein